MNCRELCPYQILFNIQIQSRAKSDLERKVYLDLLEDSRLQIMRFGEPNIRQLEGSDLQILGFRCFKMNMSRDSRSNKML